MLGVLGRGTRVYAPKEEETWLELRRGGIESQGVTGLKQQVRARPASSPGSAKPSAAPDMGQQMCVE